MFVFVVVSQYVVAGDGVAAVGNDISALEALFGEVQCCLAVNFVVNLFCNLLFFLLVAVE